MSYILIKTYNFDAEQETHLYRVCLRAWRVQEGVLKPFVWCLCL